MAQQKDDARPLPSPALNAPRNEAIVDGRDVTFDWEPVEEATGYRIEVAVDSAFESIIYAAETSGETQVRVADTFPTDGEAFFWRVIAFAPGREGNGDSIESFISATPELAAQHIERPEDELDPASSLLKSAAVTAGREATGSDKLQEEEYEEGVEPESVASGQILGLALAIGAAVAAIACILIFWTGSVYTEARSRAVSLSGYPELREVRASEAEALLQYRILDDTAGIYSIPIEQAMDRLVEEARGTSPRTYSRELPLLPGNQGASAQVED